MIISELSDRFKPCDSDYGPVESDEIPSNTDPACIWTCIDTDSGTAIVSGTRLVNRYAYWICQVPVPAGEYYEIVFDDKS